MKYILLILTLAFMACHKNDFIKPQSQKFVNELKTNQDKEIHRLFNLYKDSLNTIGFTIGVLKNDSNYFYGYGETAVGNQQVPQTNTFYEIGSITKVFTAITVTDFLQSRNLPLTESVQAYLPKQTIKLEKEGVSVTFKHILTHTSGLPYMPTNMGLKLLTNIDQAWKQYDSTKLYNCLKDVKLDFTPGTNMMYSNLAMGTLGTLLERNLHQEYIDVIQEKVLNPLGLVDTKKVLSQSDFSRMAVGYVGSKRVDYWDDLGAMDGAGVLRSTTSDMLKFAKANIQLPQSSLGKVMEACQQTHFEGKIKENGNNIKMGLGWVKLKLDDSLPEALFHNGGTGGFSTNLLIFKENKTALVVFFNSMDTDEKVAVARQMFMKKLAKVINQ